MSRMPAGRHVLPVLLFLLGGTFSQMHAAPPARWSEAKAQQWYAAQPWLVGANFIPVDAINQLEMWQAESFDPAEIDKELGWAEGLGMNTMRVFLHDQLWQQDAPGFQKRIDTFSASRQSTTSSRCSCCSIPAGTRSSSWDRSGRRFLVCTTPAGCRARARRRSRMQQSIHG